MTDQKGVAPWRAAYDAFAVGDLPTVLKGFHKDAVILRGEKTHNPRILFGEYVGEEGINRFFYKEMPAIMDVKKFDAKVLTLDDASRRGVAAVEVIMHSKNSGREYVGWELHTFEVAEDGTLKSLIVFTSADYKSIME
eukprot:ANDGO_01606.mRNA.1 hypothetical protein